MGVDQEAVLRPEGILRTDIIIILPINEPTRSIATWGPRDWGEHQPQVLSTYSPTYSPTYLSTYLLIYLFTYIHLIFTFPCICLVTFRCHTFPRTYLSTLPDAAVVLGQAPGLDDAAAAAAASLEKTAVYLTDDRLIPIQVLTFLHIYLSIWLFIYLYVHTIYLFTHAYPSMHVRACTYFLLHTCAFLHLPAYPLTHLPTK